MIWGENSLSLLNKYQRRSLALAVGLFLLSIYGFSYRGGFHSVDEVSMFAVTESIAKFGRFNTDQIAWTQWTTSQAEAQGFFGQGGHVYSKKGLALSLAQLPFYSLALYLPGVGMLQTVSLLNAFITAATGLLLLMFLDRLGFPMVTSIGVTLVFGLATIVYVYAKYLFSEPLAGFLLLLTAYMLFTYRQEAGLQHLVIAGLGAGFAVSTRANNLFLLPLFGLYLLWTIRSNHPEQKFDKTLLLPLFTFGGTVVFVGAILMVYNALRSGNPFQTGYDLTLFSPMIFQGFYKLLFSPLRGLFIYSPILLLSLPGWWLLRRTHPAEAWLFLGLVGVTVGLFSAWSSGEGLSWGSRFLVPVVPFFALVLAPLLERWRNPSQRGVLWILFHLLWPLSFFIQILGVVINPWVFLARLQAEFGGEFFLEKTAALYNFRYSQIVGQLESWSAENSDLAWWQTTGLDPIAFTLSLIPILTSGWLLWHYIRAVQTNKNKSPRPLYLNASLILIIFYALLAHYYHTDPQFGPPNDSYTQALNQAAEQATPHDVIITVQDSYYHVPMNRFKHRKPMIGFARQEWPPPSEALPLLQSATKGENSWLITIGFQPAAPDNSAERWLTFNAFKINEQWFDDSVRLVHYSQSQPLMTRPLGIKLGQEPIELLEIQLNESLQAGQTLPIQMDWLAHHPPQIDYIQFLQLLNIDGIVVSQQDTPPNSGYSPTSTWTPEQIITTRLGLLLPSDLPSGSYRLITGLYHPTNGQRLQTSERQDFIELGIITVNSK